MDLEDELRMLLRADPDELLVWEAAGYTEGLRLLTAEYPDPLAVRVVGVILAVVGEAEAARVIQRPGRVLIAMRDSHAETRLADLAARIRATLPMDCSVDAVRDGAR